jgi:hypothetical protein
MKVALAKADSRVHEGDGATLTELVTDAGGVVTATLPLSVANGGTASATASAARTALGVAASGANTDITSLTPTTSTVSGLVTAGSVKLDTGTKTATASSGAATLAKSAGKVTTEALTTAGLASYTLTLTDTAIAAADQVFASVANGTNSQGTPAVGLVTPGAGSAVIIINNLHATQALNGTLVISFMVLKN